MGLSIGRFAATFKIIGPCSYDVSMYTQNMRHHLTSRRLWAESALGVVTAVMVSSSARADLVGVAVFREEVAGAGTPPPGPERWIYRIYAEFTDPSDAVRSWGGLSVPPFVYHISNTTSDGSPGSGFTNVPDSGLNIFNVSPPFSGTARDWDSYMTIGVLYGLQGPSGLDGTQVFPGTAPFIPNGDTTWPGIGGVFLSGDQQQGRGDYRVTGKDTEFRVLLAQIIVNSGEHVNGFVEVGWRRWGTADIIYGSFEFNSIPASPTLSLLALCANLRIGRRRGRH